MQDIWSFDLTSHTLTQQSLPPDAIIFSLGCAAIEYTPDKWPWKSFITLFCSKSHALTFLSSPQLNRYGLIWLIANPLIVLTCPVNDTFNLPLARSQNFIILSEEPVTNLWKI